MHRLRCATILPLLLAAAASWAAGVYKWTDADGKLHFGDKPPPDVQAEELRTRSSGGADGEQRLEALQQEADAIFERRREAEARAAAEREEAEMIAAHCRSLRENLSNLRASTRLQTVNDQGEREFIDEQTRQKWISDAEAEIAKHCE